MRFLVDAQLPTALLKYLRGIGRDAHHLQDAGLLKAVDGDIWAFAVSTGAALMTKDADFAAMRATRTEGPVVVWLRVGNLSNRDLIGIVDKHLAAIEAAILAGEALVEIVLDD